MEVKFDLTIQNKVYSTIERKCLRCAKEFRGFVWQKYCSKKCCDEQQIANQKGDQWLIFNRDGFRCIYCGSQTNEVELRCDHIFPVSSGGDDTAGNLVTACNRCNSAKHAGFLSASGKQYVFSEVARRNAESGIPFDKQIKGSHSAEKRRRSR